MFKLARRRYLQEILEGSDSGSGEGRRSTGESKEMKQTLEREDIIRMALEAGARDSANPDKWGILEISYESLERFAALVAAHEREECAKISETPFLGEQDDITMQAKDRVAAAIRARGEK